MTAQEKIDELRRLEQAATAGRWLWEPAYGDDKFRVGETIYARDHDWQHGMNLFGRLDPDKNGENNLNLVCATRNALPALLDVASAAARMQKEISEECWDELAAALSRLAEVKQP